MVFHGSMSIFMVFHGSRLVFHGSRPVFIVFHGSWLVCHGSWSVFMVPGRHSCFSWFQVGFSWFQVGFSWFFMVSHGSRLVFHGFSCFFMVPGWFFMVFHQNVPARTCILARQSNLGLPPVGRHRTFLNKQTNIKQITSSMCGATLSHRTA